MSAILLLAAHSMFAQSLQYIENKGQWDSKVKFKSDMGGSAFFLQQQGYKVLLNNKEDLQKLSGHSHGATGSQPATSQANSDKSVTPAQEDVVLHSFAYEVNFVGSSPNATIIPDKPINTVNNYYVGNDKSKWASGCRIFNAVTYQDIYKGVDVRYYTDNGNLKYDLIVHPGADASNIAMRFDGVQGLSVKNGNLIVKTSLGEVSELNPYCYQLDNKGRNEVDAKYSIDGNTVRFKLNNYSKTATLVIDPQLIFASFTGSTTDNWGYTATYDGSGNFYAGGIAFGSGYPVSTGAFQTLFQGGSGPEGFDVAIIKLSANGTNRLYGTFLGGAGNEQPHSMIVDNDGNLVVAGRTTSGDFPVTSPIFGLGGEEDIFIAKLSENGAALLGSRKIGGTGKDGVNIRDKQSATGASSITRNYGDDARSEVIVDKANNIYLASCTQSSNFPVTSNAFQKANGGGLQDGVVIKASPDLSNILFSTYIGGSGDDAAFVLSLNPTNSNIYVGGATTSNNLKATGGNNGPNLFSSFQGGVCDGFVSIISNDGISQLKTVYVGTSGNDMLYGVQFDKFGFPYVTGTTTVSFPVSANVAFKSQAGGKQFITKLNPDLSSIVYSTNFGKGLSVPDISTTAFLVDRCENVYVAGWGGGLNSLEGYPNANTLNLSTTSNAIRPTSDGSDFYFFVLEKNGLSQLYGTFYGNVDTQPDVGDHVDGGTSRFDKEGVIYEAICANCGGVGFFPTTPGVWGPDNLAAATSHCNEAALKIAFELSGVGSGIQSAIKGVKRDTSGCLPLTVDFSDTIGTGKKFIWSFSDGTPDVTTLTPTISHTFNSLGKFRVRLISIDSLTCNISDTSYTNIRVRDDEAILSFTNLKLPPCDSLKYQFNNTSVPPAGKPFRDNSFEWSFGDGSTIITNAPNVVHSYPAPGQYKIALRLLDTAYCNAPDSATLTLNIAANVKAQFETPPSGCAPYDAVFTNTSLAGQQFFWNFGDGTPTSNLESPVHQYQVPGIYTIKLKVIDANTCNLVDSTEQTITVSDKPTSIFAFSPQTPKENTPYEFTNFSLGATLYKWKFGDGDSIVTTKKDTIVTHIFKATGTYNVCLIAFNIFGCSDTSCQEVQAIIFPVVDVPNALTPNGDGVNDGVSVKGFGIQKMNWRIYNRWGTLIFQTTSQSQSWDGKYKGVIQPQEVYVYVLDVTFTDGTNFRKKGDITLLR